jgi:hypothetical protein
MANAELAGNRVRGPGVCGVYCTLAELDVEAEGGCNGNEGVEDPHSGLPGTLQEIVVSICQGSRQVHLSNLFKWLLLGKDQQSQGVSLPHANTILLLYI